VAFDGEINWMMVNGKMQSIGERRTTINDPTR